MTDPAGSRTQMKVLLNNEQAFEYPALAGDHLVVATLDRATGGGENLVLLAISSDEAPTVSISIPADQFLAALELVRARYHIPKPRYCHSCGTRQVMQ